MTPPQAGPPLVERLGKYRLLRQIGEGGMARVYEAEHIDLNRRVAIKRLHSAHFADALTVERFLNEARAVQGVEHPNLVTIYDIVETTDPPEVALVMEYLEGRDLGHILREQGPLDPTWAAKLCAEACDGLAAVHSRGVIHRDLKPDNLFLAREHGGRERVKLLDFGVARLGELAQRAFRTKTGQTVGTPAYMSPEQATASPLDGRSDLYMLGVVLFELVTGQPPFHGKGYGDVMLMHVHDPPPIPSTLNPRIPKWLDQVILRSLEKEPGTRFADALEMAAALRSQAPVDVTLPVIKLPPPERMSSHKWRLLVGGIIALGLALVVTALLLPWHIDKPKPQPQPPQVVPSPPPAPPTPPHALLHVETVPPGATIAVAATPRCSAPCDVELPAPGAPPVEITATAPGFAVAHQLVDANAASHPLKMVLTPPGKSRR